VSRPKFITDAKAKMEEMEEKTPSHQFPVSKGHTSKREIKEKGKFDRGKDPRDL
jgi:hypothetical protein